MSMVAERLGSAHSSDRQLVMACMHTADSVSHEVRSGDLRLLTQKVVIDSVLEATICSRSSSPLCASSSVMWGSTQGSDAGRQKRKSPLKANAYGLFCGANLRRSTALSLTRSDKAEMANLAQAYAAGRSGGHRALVSCRQAEHCPCGMLQSTRTTASRLWHRGVVPRPTVRYGPNLHAAAAFASTSARVRDGLLAARQFGRPSKVRLLMQKVAIPEHLGALTARREAACFAASAPAPSYWSTCPRISLNSSSVAPARTGFG